MRQIRKEQLGGDATPLPWEWYNPNVPPSTQMMDYNITSPEMPQIMIPTSGPSGNSPYLVTDVPTMVGGSKMGGSKMGGSKPGSKDVQLIEKFRASKKPLKDLGDGIMVITEKNIKKLFCYLYFLYPKLKQNNETKLLFEKADQDNAFIWAEMANSPLDEVIPSIVESTINFYDDNHSDPNARRHIREVFGLGHQVVL